MKRSFVTHQAYSFEATNLMGCIEREMRSGEAKLKVSNPAGFHSRVFPPNVLSQNRRRIAKAKSVSVERLNIFITDSDEPSGRRWRRVIVAP